MFKKLAKFLALSIPLLTGTASAQDSLVLATFNAKFIHSHGVPILKSAYEKLGIKIEIMQASSARALLESTRGNVDGEVARVFGIDQKYPTLVRVDVPIGYIDLALFITDNNGMEWLVEDITSKRIGRVHGIVIAEKYTKDWSNVRIAHSHVELFKLLSAGDIDVAISGVPAASRAIERLSLEKIQMIEPLVGTIPLYHYLHERHRNLVPRIEGVLLEMQKVSEGDSLGDEHQTRTKAINVATY